MIVWSIMSWSVYEPESCVKNNRERCLGLGQMASFGHLTVAQNPTFHAGFYAINQRRRHGGKHELDTMNTRWGTVGPCCSPLPYEEE